MRRDVDSLRARTFDALIIGGGIHGAWIAMRCARAGLQVALIERADFGAATSANSLKVLHGGLRYLQHLDFQRMRASIGARREYARAFAHLVQPLPCLMPLKVSGVRSPWIFGPALMMNELVSLDRNSGVPDAAHLPAGYLMSARRCREAIKPLADVEPAAGGVWWDAIVLDSGRMSIEPVLEASRLGAVVANRVEAREYLIEQGKVVGARALDRLSGRELEIRAKVTVNASGPWAAELSRASDLPEVELPRNWIGALNLVLRRSLGITKAVALSSKSRAADSSAVLKRAQRELFFVPWRDVTMIGTDYHRVPSPLNGAPRFASEEAISAFIEDVRQVAPRANISHEDVARVHWGILPAETDAPDVPRKSPVIATGKEAVGASQLLVLVAEKLTSAPSLSKKVCDWIRQNVPDAAATPRAEAFTTNAPESAIEEPVRRYLRTRYGAHWPAVLSKHSDLERPLEPVAPQSETLRVEVVHAIREEMALDLEDVVVRRLGLCERGHPGTQVLEAVSQVAAKEFSWSEADRQAAVRSLDESLRQYGCACS